MLYMIAFRVIGFSIASAAAFTPQLTKMSAPLKASTLPASDEKLQSPAQTESELSFLEEIANQMMAYHRTSTETKSHNGPVLSNSSPQSLRSTFAAAGVPLEFESSGWSSTQLREAVSLVLDTSAKTSSPLFLNQLYAGVDPIALAGEWMSATLNSNVHTFEVSPTLTEIEKSCLEKIARCWLNDDGEESPAHDGLFVPGGSISNLYSLLLARDRMDPTIRQKGMDRSTNPLVAFCSDSAHYSYKKSAIVTGLGEDNLIEVQSDDSGAMDPASLREAIAKSLKEGKRPFYVGTTAGTTVLGAFDPFDEIVSVCNEFTELNGGKQLWVHVDGAWGGGAMLSPTQKHLMSGAEHADSFCWNPHKMLGIPLQCSAFVTRHPGSLQKANSAFAEYLFQPDKNNANADLGDRTIQCGRKADALKLWLSWKARGDEGFAKCIDRSFGLGKFMQSEVETSNDKFVMVRDSQCSNVCFWYIPPRLRPFDPKTASKDQWTELSKVAPKMKNLMQDKGDAMIGFQPITDKGLVNFFRLVLPSPRHVTELDLREMLARMDAYGQEF